MSQNSAFKANFSALLKAAGDKTEQVVRRTAIELQSELVSRSPVDTGRFRSNWNCGIGAVLETTTQSTANEAVAKTSNALKRWRAGQSIYLTNSLPYAKPLEYGHSSQAPMGMVRLTVTGYSLALQRAVSITKKG